MIFLNKLKKMLEIDLSDLHMKVKAKNILKQLCLIKHALKII